MLAGLDPASPLTHEEIFGPVAPIVGFGDADEAVRLANDTEMGLTAYVYTGDLAQGLDVSERIQAGMVGLNRGAVSDPAAPFGGMKQSRPRTRGSERGHLRVLRDAVHRHVLVTRRGAFGVSAGRRSRRRW